MGIHTLDICGGTLVVSPTDEGLRSAVMQLDARRGDDAFLILSSESQIYMQCCGDQYSGFELEYQEGSLDRHYRAVERPDMETVVAAFIFYANQDSRWRTVVRWEKLRL